MFLWIRDQKLLAPIAIASFLFLTFGGVDLIRLIKQNKAWEKIPVVVVTVLSRHEGIAADADIGEAFWVNKPFDAKNLLKTVQDVLASAGEGDKTPHG